VTVRTASPGDLERIELASQDELRALQLERLKWSLRHAYNHVPHFRGKCELQEVSPVMDRRREAGSG
jgi:phenylacetate-CoA ligase